MWELAHDLLAEALPRRWLHVQGVGHAAERLLVGHSPADRSLLVEAAVLHDVGYSPALMDTGFHPVDGARHLRRLNVDERVVNLVAHHSCARVEATIRRLRSILDDEFPFDPSLPHAELCFCDMTTDPDGQPISIDDRLADIRRRYGPGSSVVRSIDEAEAELRATVSSVEGQYLAQPR